MLHGGEPLLLGADGLRAVLATLRAGIPATTELHLLMQTNGVLLTADICDVLREYAVLVGVSLDGDATANDRHRRFAGGESSHDLVLRALALLRRPEYRAIYGGLLCTIDVRNDPITVYEALLAQEPPGIDFLLPHATWDALPPRPGADPAPYASWLRRIHARWVRDGRPVAIRLFDSLATLAAGGPSGTEALGLAPVDLLVIETDGAWEQADSLKVAYEGAPATGAHVVTHSVDDVVAATPGIRARLGGLSTLSAQCRQCAVVRTCGGGMYAHRYRRVMTPY